MSSAPRFEWTVVEQESEWQALSMGTEQPRARPAQHIFWRSPWLWALVGLLLVSAGGGVFALERTADAGWKQIEHDLRDAVGASVWASPAPGPQSSGLPAVQLMQAEVHGTQAVVQAVVTQTLASGETVAYQTTDFYLQSAAGWVRTAPSPTLLGPLQSLATEHFSFRYYAVDAPVVRAIAPRLEALYLQACASFGLSPLPEPRRDSADLVAAARPRVHRIGLVFSSPR